MIKIKNIEDILQSSEVLYNEPLRNYSFTKTGGNAEILVKINNEKDLQNVIAYSNENNIELTILGNGSNVLISDSGIQGIVALTSDMNDIELLEGDVISCYAGLTLKELTDFCIENSLTNLEFSCGIPGSVGGAIFMNAGAYGGEMKEVVQKVEVTVVGIFGGQNKGATSSHMELYDNIFIADTQTTKTLYNYEDGKEIYQDATFLVDGKDKVDSIINDAKKLPINWKQYMLVKSNQNFPALQQSLDTIYSLTNGVFISTIVFSIVILSLTISQVLKQQNLLYDVPL